MEYADKFYKTILNTFSRIGKFKKSVQKSKLNIDDKILENKEFIQEQTPFFSNASSYTQLTEKLSHLETAIAEYNTALDNVHEFLDTNHRKLEISIIQTDYQVFEGSDPRTLDEDVEIRSLETEEVKAYIYALKNNNSDWRYAGADINPTDTIFTATAVASDPLYIVADDNLQALVKKEFNDFYGQRRLRCYHDVTSLPDNALGTIYCFGKYEFMPLDPVKDELTVLFDKLMPGGEIFFSYNNCDYQSSLDFCGYRSYQTQELISSITYGLGFDMVTNVSFNDGGNSIMTIKKPGTLVSQKKTTPSIDISTLVAPGKPKFDSPQIQAEATKSGFDAFGVYIGESKDVDTNPK
jgi:hypothetical protein